MIGMEEKEFKNREDIKMKKRFGKQIALLLAAVITLGVVGCGKEEAEPPKVNQEQGVDGQQETDTPKETDSPKETDNLKETDAPKEAASPKETDNLNEAVPEAVPTAATLTPSILMAENAPTVTAQAAILASQETGTILFEKNSNEKIYPASMTKILTALVVMDHFTAEELVVVGTEINEVTLDSSKAGHVVGETLTIRNLIRGLIIPSGNDSANVLATVVSKRTEDNPNLTFAQSETVFAELMNAKAKELGALNSHFTNAHGYHNENHYSTVYDMALFAKAFMNDSALAEIAGEKNFTGNGADGMFVNDPSILTQEYAWRSHNLLLTENEYNYGYATGIKTGFHDEAGDCVSATAKKDGDTLICIVANSPDPGRWMDAKNLFEFGFNSYEKAQLGDEGAVVEEVTLTKHNRLNGDTMPVVFGKNMNTYLPMGTEARLTMKTNYAEPEGVENKDGTYSLKAPLAKGEKVGTVSYELDGKTLLTEDVFAGADVAKGSIWSNIKYFFQNFFAIVFSLKGLIGFVILLVVLGIIYLLIRFFGGRRRRYSGGYSFQRGARRKKIGKGRRRF